MQANPDVHLIDQAIVVTPNAFDRSSTTEDNNTGNRKKPIIVEPEPVGKWNGYELYMIPWGKKNLWPNEVIARMAECGVGKKALRFSSKAHSGRGVSLYREESQDGKLVQNFIDDKTQPKISEWLKANRISRYLRASIEDYEWFFISFSEIIFSKDCTQVNKIRHKEAVFCRLTKPVKIGDLDVCFMVYSDKFLEGETVKVEQEDVVTMPVIDPYWTKDEVKKLLKRFTDKRACYISAYPTVGRFYYPDADWHSVVRNQWVDVSAMVPAAKAAIMRNQSTIKYHIEIALEYWKQAYPGTDESPGWMAMSREEKEKAIGEVLGKINSTLAGSKNAGKSIQSPKHMIGNKLESLWTITPIDDKLKDGAYLPDSEAANTEILFAIGVDPSLIGHGSPGGKLGAGSGSDKREAYNIFIALKGSDRDVTLEPLNYIKEYNGWDEDVKIGIRDIQLTTLDKNPTGTQNVAS
ncbi:MAG: hypothetical protein HRT61_23845 [Ekhidna sp.]|nr:hypothetical protein [Ekhidna sp.]